MKIGDLVMIPSFDLIEGWQSLRNFVGVPGTLIRLGTLGTNTRVNFGGIPLYVPQEALVPITSLKNIYLIHKLNRGEVET